MLAWPPPSVCSLGLECDWSDVLKRNEVFLFSSGLRECVSAGTLEVLRCVRCAHGFSVGSHGMVFRLRWHRTGNGGFVRTVYESVESDVSGIGHFVSAVIVYEQWRRMIAGRFDAGILGSAVLGLRAFRAARGDVWPIGVPILNEVIGAIFEVIVVIFGYEGGAGVCELARVYEVLREAMRGVGERDTALGRFGAMWVRVLGQMVGRGIVDSLGVPPGYCFPGRRELFPATCDLDLDAIARALGDCVIVCKENGMTSDLVRIEQSRLAIGRFIPGRLWDVIVADAASEADVLCFSGNVLEL